MASADSTAVEILAPKYLVFVEIITKLWNWGHFGIPCTLAFLTFLRFL